MYHPTTRVLIVLELLQSHPQITGAEIARRLEVDIRTVRRYIIMLQDIGIPVEAERGRYGSYRLRSGFKLPPLMFTDDEALAVTLGLRMANHIGLSGAVVATVGALAKLERVLPLAVRQQVQDVEESLIIELALPEAVAAGDGVIVTSGTAIRRQCQIKLTYQAYDGEPLKRVVDPYGLVYRVGRWYLVGYCHLREDVRTFRLDRVLEVELLDTTFTRPSGIDPLQHVEKALANMPGLYRVEVLFDAPLNEVQQQIPTALGKLIECEDGVLLICYVQKLAWIAGYLAGMTLPMTIQQPDELREEMRRLIERVQMTLNRS